METNTATAAKFADMIRPYFDRIANEGLSAEDHLAAAVLLWKEQEDKDFSHRLTQSHILTDALAGTYDEFRAERAA